MKLLPLCLLLLLAGACAPPEPPLPLAAEGEVCAIDGNRTHSCPSGLTCKPSTASDGTGAGPGQQCGGLAGTPCKPGLTCDVSECCDQVGVCVNEWVCAR